MKIVKTFKNARIEYDNDHGFVMYELETVQGKKQYTGVSVLVDTKKTSLPISEYIGVVKCAYDFNLIKLNKGEMHIRNNNLCFIGSITAYKD